VIKNYYLLKNTRCRVYLVVKLNNFLLHKNKCICYHLWCMDMICVLLEIF